MLSPGSQTVFNLRGITATYDANTQTVTCNNLRAKLAPVDGVISLRIFLDRTAFEVYGNDGRIYIPLVVFPEEKKTLSVACVIGQVEFESLTVHELRSIWSQ